MTHGSLVFCACACNCACPFFFFSRLFLCLSRLSRVLSGVSFLSGAVASCFSKQHQSRSARSSSSVQNLVGLGISGAPCERNLEAGPANRRCICHGDQHLESRPWGKIHVPTLPTDSSIPMSVLAPLKIRLAHAARWVVIERIDALRRPARWDPAPGGRYLPASRWLQHDLLPLHSSGRRPMTTTGWACPSELPHGPCCIWRAAWKLVPKAYPSPQSCSTI